ncbi:MAG: hypothetical protein RI958_3008 [Actinomycetota bacterium]
MIPSQRSLSIVLPMYGHADHADEIVSELYGAIADLSDQVELVLVPNGPDDGTVHRCRALCADRPWLVVLDQQPAGWGRAVNAGLRAARGDLLCYTNAARTRPSDLRTAVSLALLNPDHAVKAVRRSRDAWYRRLGSALYNLEVRSLFGLASWDVNGTPKAFPRDFTELCRLTEQGDLVDVEWLVALHRNARPLIEFPLLSSQRRSGRSTTRWKSALVMYAGAIRLRRRLGSAGEVSR